MFPGASGCFQETLDVSMRRASQWGHNAAGASANANKANCQEEPLLGLVVLTGLVWGSDLQQSSRRAWPLHYQIGTGLLAVRLPALGEAARSAA
jgi:hypothetical protein